MDGSGSGPRTALVIRPKTDAVAKEDRMRNELALHWDGERVTYTDEAALVRAAQQGSFAFAPLYRLYLHED